MVIACRSPLRLRQGHSARPHDCGAGGGGRDRRDAAVRRGPNPARQSRPASRRGGLSRARKLSARPGHRRRAPHRRLEAARVRARRRRRAGDRLRLHRAADRKPRFAGRHRGRHQSEKLDRTPRRFHARDRRRDPRLRPRRGRLSRAALCGDQSKDLSGAGARRLAAVANPLSPRRRCARRAKRCARCMRASVWSIAPKR